MVEEGNSANPINVVRLAELSRNLHGVQLLVEKISFDLEGLRAEVVEIKNQNQQNEKLLEKVQSFSREFNLLQQQVRKDSLVQEEMKKHWKGFTLFKNQISSDVQHFSMMLSKISDENEKQYKLFTDRYNFSIEEST